MRHGTRVTLAGQLDLLLLSALSSEPAHGHAVIEELRRRSDGAFDLPESTVYPALHRLEQAKEVESDWAEVGGRRRRVYTPDRQGALGVAQAQTRVVAAAQRHRCRDRRGGVSAMASAAVERYLLEFSDALVAGAQRRERILCEVEDHLRDATESLIA